MSAVPHVSGWPLLGSLPDMRADPLGVAVRLRDAGDVSTLTILGRTGWVLSHPDHVEELLVGAHRDVIKDQMTRHLTGVLGNGLLVAEGEAWRRHRRLAAPAFTPRAVEGYAAQMGEIADRHAKGWPSGVADVHALFVAMTREIVLRTVFGTDRAGQAVDAVDVLMVEFVRQIRSVRRLLPEWVPTRGRRRVAAASARLDADLMAIVAEKRAGALGDDLCSVLMAARDEDGKPAFDDRQLRDELITMYLAGHETTALALTYTAWLLAHDPEANRRVRDEAKALTGPPTAADLPKLPWCAAVIDEALRLYPPAWAIGRETTAPMAFGGFDVPTGSSVWVFPWAIHRDPRWWDDPLKFRPQRWLTPVERPRFAFLPFGGGPRVCIGSHFARMEAILCLAAVAKHQQFQVAHDPPLRFLASVTLRPSDPVPLRLARR